MTSCSLNCRLLVAAFDHDQSDRYSAFRRLKLRKEVVRKVSISLCPSLHSNPLEYFLSLNFVFYRLPIRLYLNQFLLR